MKKFRSRREPLRKSGSCPSGCRSTVRHTSRACGVISATTSPPWRSQVRDKVNIRREKVPKWIKLKEMSNSNPKLPRKLSKLRRKPRTRPRLNPSPKPPQAVKEPARPKRGHRRSSSRPSSSSKIIQARRPQNSLRTLIQPREPIYFKQRPQPAAYVPPSRP